MNDLDNARIDREIMDVLFRRGTEKTICPSDVARSLNKSDWRPLMPRIRDRARALARRGVVQILQRGESINPDAPIRGPIRLGHPEQPLARPDGTSPRPPETTGRPDGAR